MRAPSKKKQIKNTPVHEYGGTLFERVLEALPDGVLITDFSRRVVYANPAFAKHWNIPSDILLEGDDRAMLRYVEAQLADSSNFLSEVERLHLISGSSEDEIHFKDGRIFSRRSVPFEEMGIFKGRIWIFSDVTDARNSLLDALTGLPNRRAYSRDFPRYTADSDDGFVRSVAVMDVDNFKKYNDLYGHAAGDAVLMQIGRIVRAQLEGADDLMFRIGGEEFLLASKTKFSVDAFTFFDQVRRSVSAMEVPHAGNAPHANVTVSLGLGTFRGPKDAGIVFERVDAALYQAKFLGRNVTVEISF